MIVSELTKADYVAWDEYLERSADGLPFQLAGWKDVLARTYGYDTPFLMARDSAPGGGERVVGVLPLFAVRSALMGNSLMTTPGAVCADNEEAAAALIERAAGVARELKVDRLILHDSRHARRGPASWNGHAELQTASHHVAWITEVSPDMDVMWKRVDRNVRRLVRKGRENEIIISHDRAGRQLGDFYDVMARFTHEMGTPVFGRSFVQNVVDAFPDRFVITGVYHQGRPIGSYFSMMLRQTLFGLWGSTLHDYLPLYASYVAYWSLLETTAGTGCHTLDMGRSPAESGASKFKGQWGGQSVPVYQQVLPTKRPRSAASGADPKVESVAGRVRTEDKFQTFGRVWSRLPLPVTRIVGPRLRRHVPFA